METYHAKVHRLDDGTVIRTRSVRSSDRMKLIAGFARFSPESRYRRFFSPTPRLTPAMLERLLDVDGHDRVAVGAELLHFGFISGNGLGIARFTRLPGQSDVAEMAVSIVDEMQGRGLGTLLLYELSAVARAHGIRRFTAWVQPDNEPMKALLAKLDPMARSHVEDGLLVFELLVPGMAEVRTEPPRRDDHDRSAVGSLAEWCADGLRHILPGRLPGWPVPHF